MASRFCAALCIQEFSVYSVESVSCMEASGKVSLAGDQQPHQSSLNSLSPSFVHQINQQVNCVFFLYLTRYKDITCLCTDTSSSWHNIKAM